MTPSQTPSKRPGDSNWTLIRERIPLDSTACHYGGSRPWFRCLGCDYRRAVLYSVRGVFRCVSCHGLAYASTREEHAGRIIRRATEIQHLHSRQTTDCG